MLLCWHFTGNRRQGADAAQLGHDDEVHGAEAGTRLKDLQSGQSRQRPATVDLIVFTFGRRNRTATRLAEAMTSPVIQLPSICERLYHTLH